MNKNKDVNFIEVGPRDGLQNECIILSLEDKVKYIDLLLAAGLKEIEIASFVRTDKIPQMKFASDLAAHFKNYKEKMIYLVPNLKGLDNASRAGVSSIAVFTSTSETFNKKNINCSIDQSLIKMAPVIERSIKEGKSVRGYISTVFGCPYEGKTSLKKVLELSRFFFSQGVYEVSLGDTIGVATPFVVRELIQILKQEFDLDKFSFHFHDTLGMAVVNSFAAFEGGAIKFDSSCGGIGGCPFAKGATGNVATEDLVYLFESLGLQTGVNLDKLFMASKFILNKLNKRSSSNYINAKLGNV